MSNMFDDFNELAGRNFYLREISLRGQGQQISYFMLDNSKSMWFFNRLNQLMEKHDVEVRFIFNENSKPTNGAILPDLKRGQVVAADQPYIEAVIEHDKQTGGWKISKFQV